MCCKYSHRKVLKMLKRQQNFFQRVLVLNTARLFSFYRDSWSYWSWFCCCVFMFIMWIDIMLLVATDNCVYLHTSNNFMNLALKQTTRMFKLGSVSCIYHPTELFAGIAFLLHQSSVSLCRNPGEDSKMLVCDMCDKGYHTFCLQPAMDSLPTNGWRCKVGKTSCNPGCLIYDKIK